MSRRATTRWEAARAICDQAEGELRIASAMFPAQPDELLREVIAEAGQRGLPLTILAADLTGRFAFIADDDLVGDCVHLVTIGGRVPQRFGGRADNVPTSLWEIARRFESGQLGVDVFVGTVANARDGHHSMGPIVAYGPAALGAARYVALELDRSMLPLPGYPGPAVDDVDLLIDCGAGPLPDFAPRPARDNLLRIGVNLAQLIPDGSTLQLGIGGIPEGFVRALTGKRALGIHSGAIPEGAIELIDGGVFTGERKARDQRVHVTTSLLGSHRLYAYAAERRHRIELHPVTVTHAPATLAAQRSFFAINSAYEIDLTGQVKAEVVDGLRASSGGGQVDFGKWAHISDDGANIVALPARSGGGRSRIVPRLSSPPIVTTHRSDLDFAVTEFGVADLRGRTAEERAQALIEIAHPEDRRSLAGAVAD
jgi:4-hydroxybutyrate CoA-transferase